MARGRGVHRSAVPVRIDATTWVTDRDDFADAIRRILKGGSVIDPAVVAVLVGRRSRVPLDDLTERERAVLALMAEDRSNQAIGDRLSLARKTVEAHTAGIFSKLELQPASDDHRGCSPCLPTYAG